MSDITTAFWGMTINNYDETDLALVQQGYPDYIRQIVYTLEKGEQGTPHIQAYIKLNRQQRLSYVKKLFPRGSFKPLTNDEYKLNSQRYAQKLDKTAESAAVISNNPFPDPVKELLEVIEDALRAYAPTNNPSDWRFIPAAEVGRWTTLVENARVVDKPQLAKFYISSTYVKVWRNFHTSLIVHVCDKVERENRAEKLSYTHTHTHGEEKFSRQRDTPDGHDSGEEGSEQDDDSQDEEEYDEGSESDGDEDCQTTGSDDSSASR